MAVIRASFWASGWTRQFRSWAISSLGEQSAWPTMRFRQGATSAGGAEAEARRRVEAFDLVLVIGSDWPFADHAVGDHEPAFVPVVAAICDQGLGRRFAVPPR